MAKTIAKRKGQSELDNSIYKLNIQKRDLMVKEFNNKITTKQYEKEISIIGEEWQRLIQLKIAELSKEQQIIDKKYTEKKQEVVEKEKIIKKQKKKQSNAGRKPVTDSYLSLILKALQHPKINTEAKVVAVVLEWKPGLHEVNLKQQIRNMISLIKNKKERRYEEYEWDSENYKVNKTCQTKLY